MRTNNTIIGVRSRQTETRVFESTFQYIAGKARG